MKPTKTRIAHICEGFIGGTNRYFRVVLPELAKRDFDVTLLCSLKRSPPNASETIAKLRQCGVTVYIIPLSREINPLRDIWSFIILLRLLRKEQFDIVHTHCSKAGFLGRICALLAGTKVIAHTPHCFAFMRCKNKFKKWLYLHIERFLGTITTKLVTVSESESAIARNSHIVPRSRCIVVDNALGTSQLSVAPSVSKKNMTTIKRSFGINKDTLVVSTVCRLVDYKGIYRFLNATRFSSTDNTVFLIAGDGRLRNKVQKHIMRHLCNKVRLLGYVVDINKIYAISDVVVLCSDAEGQPYSLLEAMRAKCPIIATSVFGNRDLISHEQTGYLVEREPSSIARAIDCLLNDEVKRKRYAKNAYMYFCEHHNLEKQITKLTEVYTNCVDMYK